MSPSRIIFNIALLKNSTWTKVTYWSNIRDFTDYWLFTHCLLPIVEWYAQQDPERFLFHTGEQATSLDTATHSVTTSEGRSISYDYCVLATGSKSTLPPYISTEKAERARGVFIYRNISDLDKTLFYSGEAHVKGGCVRLTHGNAVRWSLIMPHT